MATVDELKKLSPEERIRRLKELEDERKKEIAEAEELIKETVSELARADDKIKTPIPEVRVTDLSTLNTLEERQLVTTHHNLPEAALLAVSPQPKQQKTLEEVAAEETPRQQTPQHDLLGKGQSKFQKPDYAIGTEQQRPAFGEYLSKSLQTVTGGAPPGSSELEKITEIYKDRAVTGAEADDAQQKYFGTHQQVTGGYELRKREEEDRKVQYESQKKRGGPA